MGDKHKLIWPEAPKVGDKCARQVQDKRETSVNFCGPRHPESETSVEDKGKTIVNSYGARHPEWEASVGDKYGRQVGDKCKLVRPQAPRVGDKRETNVNSRGPRHPSGKQVWKTNERHVRDKCKLMQLKALRVRDKCGRQVWETSVGDKCELMRPKEHRVGANVRDKCLKQV